jgi:thiol-disulfide isomerase/thioredoxin
MDPVAVWSGSRGPGGGPSKLQFPACLRLETGDGAEVFSGNELARLKVVRSWLRSQLRVQDRAGQARRLRGIPRRESATLEVALLRAVQRAKVNDELEVLPRGSACRRAESTRPTVTGDGPVVVPRRPSSLRPVAVLVVIALAVVALNRGTRPAATATEEAPAAAEGAGGSAAGDFLAFTATDARTVTVPDSGPDAKPVVVFFMASWCASCIEEARAMTALENEYTDRGRFVAVEVTPNAPPQEIAKFQAAAGNPAHPYLVDRRGDLTSAYGVTVLDTTGGARSRRRGSGPAGRPPDGRGNAARVPRPHPHLDPTSHRARGTHMRAVDEDRSWPVRATGLPPCSANGHPLPRPSRHIGRRERSGRGTAVPAVKDRRSTPEPSGPTSAWRLGRIAACRSPGPSSSRAAGASATLWSRTRWPVTLTVKSGWVPVDRTSANRAGPSDS